MMTLEELKALLEEQGHYNQWKKNSGYWANRFELLEDALNNKGIEYYHDLERMYQKAANETEKEIAKWYTRYAKEEGISFNEAKKQLSTTELKEFRMSLSEYIEKGESLDPRWKKELERASTKYHVTRLEALKMQMQHQAEVLMGNEAQGVNELIKGFYTDAYYHSIYEIQKGIGVGFDFAKLDTNAVDKVLSKPWTADGLNFSERIWGKHRPELIKKLHDGLTLNIARGESPDKLIDEITKAFNVKKNQAANLVQTEKAYFQTVAQYDSFKELDVEMYEITATLDSKTSEICQFMDGKTFSMKDFQPGVTAPPFHNRCRTAIAPYFDDEFDFIDERAARDENGQYYTVPSSMKYGDWYKAFVDGDESILEKLKTSKVVKVVEVIKNDSEGLTNRRKERMLQRNKPKAINKLGNEIQFDFNVNNEKELEIKNIIEMLSSQYDTNLQKVTIGKIQGSAGIATNFGQLMNLNSKKIDVAIHEFAHTLDTTQSYKLKLSNNGDFWKEIRKVRNAYHRDVDKLGDSLRWISTYEHSHQSVDEFLAEAFTHAKLKELGYEKPYQYGNDYTYSQKVLDIVDKYFGKGKKEPKYKLDNQLFSRKPKDYGTIRLPKDEYAHVMSELNTNLTKEQLKMSVVTKPIGNYVYTVEIHGFDEYRIIGKKPIKSIKR